MVECMKFIQAVVYNGKYEEDYVETRIRLYEMQKKKTSRTLPPDPNSCQQAILRAHHQAYQYVRVSNKIIKQLPLEANDWLITDEGVLPLWFTCSQLPPSITSRKKNVSKTLTDGNEADDETTVEPPARKKMRKSTSGKSFKDLCKDFGKDYDADSDCSNMSSNDDEDSNYDDDWEHLSDFGSDSENDSDSDW